MRKGLLTLVVVVLLLSGFVGVKSAEPLFVNNSTVSSIEDPANEIIVGYKANADVTALSKQVEKTTGAKLSRKGLKNFAVFKLPPGKSADVVMNVMKKDPNVEYVEPNYIAHAFDVPNDPFFNPYQWNLYDYGMTSNGYVSNYGIQAVSAWTITRGAGVKVAIIDTGVAYENYGGYTKAPDLANTLFDTANAYDFVNNDTHANDDNSHGTHVAGTIA